MTQERVRFGNDATARLIEQESGEREDMNREKGNGAPGNNTTKKVGSNRTPNLGEWDSETTLQTPPREWLLGNQFAGAPVRLARAGGDREMHCACCNIYPRDRPPFDGQHVFQRSRVLWLGWKTTRTRCDAALPQPESITISSEAN